MVKLKQVSTEDIETVVSFLADMQSELQQHDLDRYVTSQIIAQALEKDVHWFLFLDKQDRPFGTCHLQSVHNYWREGKRFYLGGFYIAPPQRGRGLLKEIFELLKIWASEKGGVQIYAHIHQDNERSLRAFRSVGLVPDEYLLCINHWGA